MALNGVQGVSNDLGLGSVQQGSLPNSIVMRIEGIINSPNSSRNTTGAGSSLKDREITYSPSTPTNSSTGEESEFKLSINTTPNSFQTPTRATRTLADLQASMKKVKETPKLDLGQLFEDQEMIMHLDYFQEAMDVFNVLPAEELQKITKEEKADIVAYAPGVYATLKDRTDLPSYGAYISSWNAFQDKLLALEWFNFFG